MSTYARCQSIAAVDVMVFQNVAMQYEEVVYGNESISICLLAFAIGIHSIWLHHMYWCGVLGEDYDGFICVMNSNLFLLTRMIVVSLCFPKFSQRGFYRGFIMNECTLMMIFVQVFSQWGFLGLYFMVQSKTRSLSIGVPYWLEGSVWWYCCGILTRGKEYQYSRPSTSTPTIVRTSTQRLIEWDSFWDRSVIKWDRASTEFWVFAVAKVKSSRNSSLISYDLFTHTDPFATV